MSTLDQKPELQLDGLKAIGCVEIFVEKASGSKEDRPQLSAAIDYLRAGDTLSGNSTAWPGSMKQLIGTVDQPKARGIGFRLLTEAIDTTTAAGELFFHIFGALAQFEHIRSAPMPA